MKKLYLALCVIFLSGTSFGQNVIDQHFQSYKNQDNFSKVHISSKAFELAAYLEFEDEDLSELKDFLTTVHSFDLIAGEDIQNAKYLHNEALELVERSHHELMSVMEDGGEYTFLIDESNGTVYELVMVGVEKNELIIFSLTGQMDLEQLIKMSRMLQTDEEQSIHKLYENGLHEVQVYPNPLMRGDVMEIELPDNMSGGTVSLINMNGRTVRSMKIIGGDQTMDTRGLMSGSYILEYKNEQLSIKKKVLIR